MRQWGWRAYLLVGAVLAVVYYLVPPASGQLVVLPAIGFFSVVAIVVGIRLNRPGPALPWWLFAAALTLYALGDTFYATRGRGLPHATAAFPSSIDLFYLAFYPFLLVGLGMIIRSRTAGRDAASLIDATIISTGLALVAWVFLILPYLRDPALSTVQRLVMVLYPLADMLVVAAVLRLAIGSGRRSPAWAILTGSLAALIAGDLLFGLRQLAGTWQNGGPIDLTWMALRVGLGVAALHPSMPSLAEPLPVTVRLPRGRLVLITGASLIAPAVLVIQSVRGEPLDVPVVAGGSAVLFVLALARMSGLAGEVALQQERKQAMQSVLRVTEAERSRLAAELHDGPVQQLTALLYGLELARHHVRRDSPADADELLASLEDKATGEINELRRLMTELRPPVLDELGLVSALKNQGRSFESASGVRCAVDTEPELELTPELETVLYRVAQESLRNVGKHANASKVSISLAAVDAHVRLLIRDDGVGFDPAAASAKAAAGHFGLTNMRERVELVGGKLLVDSAPGQGTTIAVEMARQIPSR
ncbi:MAG TPA: sensor histidine kinase [Actinomycetota bacterium]|jgi:signal transduction histidine kinase|nr:sensor histidine kinase [Actinomycetota bacterium]